MKEPKNIDVLCSCGRVIVTSEEGSGKCWCGKAIKLPKTWTIKSSFVGQLIVLHGVTHGRDIGIASREYVIGVGMKS